MIPTIFVTVAAGLFAIYKIITLTYETQKLKEVNEQLRSVINEGLDIKIT